MEISVPGVVAGEEALTGAVEGGEAAEGIGAVVSDGDATGGEVEVSAEAETGGGAGVELSFRQNP